MEFPPVAATERGDPCTTSLFVVDLDYVADPSQVDTHLESHREYLRRHYETGMFLASGPKEPRTGGVILATGARATIELAIGSDPFVRHGVARYTVTEFRPTMTAVRR